MILDMDDSRDSSLMPESLRWQPGEAADWESSPNADIEAVLHAAIDELVGSIQTPEEFGHTAALAGHLERRLGRRMWELREQNHYSYADFGAALDMTRQGVHTRFAGKGESTPDDVRHTDSRAARHKVIQMMRDESGGEPRNRDRSAAQPTSLTPRTGAERREALEPYNDAARAPVTRRQAAMLAGLLNATAAGRFDFGEDQILLAAEFLSGSAFALTGLISGHADATVEQVWNTIEALAHTTWMRRSPVGQALDALRTAADSEDDQALSVAQQQLLEALTATGSDLG